jgi:hypothetical protein
MRARLTSALCLGFILGGAYAYAQCITPRPATPPKANAVEIRFPNTDGGARPCFAFGITPGGQPAVGKPVANARCDVAKQIADQAVAIDNGWDDGGTP